MVLAFQQFRHAVIVRIVLRAEVGAVFEVAAALRGLQQQRRREFRTVEMPVQRLARPVSHHVGPGEGILHHMQLRLAHGRRQKAHQGLVFVDGQDGAAGDLVGADGMADRLHLAQRRMVLRQLRNLRFEVDVVHTLVHMRAGVHHRADFSHRLFGDARAQEAFQVEHAICLECGNGLVHQLLPFGAALAVDRVAIQVENVVDHRVPPEI